jgi:hypothetical protein
MLLFGFVQSNEHFETFLTIADNIALRTQAAFVPMGLRAPFVAAKSRRSKWSGLALGNSAPIPIGQYERFGSATGSTRPLSNSVRNQTCSASSGDMATRSPTNGRWSSYGVGMRGSDSTSGANNR